MPQAAYPIATDAHDALSQLRTAAGPRAVREREAESLCGARVCFVTENLGPLYERHEDALDVYRGLLGDDQACRLACRMKDPPARRGKPVEPVFKDGERWPKMARPLPSVWQLTVSYWKVIAVARRAAPAPVSKPARALRRKGGEALTPDEVRGLVDSPLTAVRPQKALDFGLFDFRLPENPEIVIADE